MDKVSVILVSLVSCISYESLKVSANFSEEELSIYTPKFSIE